MTFSDSTALFSRVAETLLRGQFICDISDEEAFKYLNVATYANAINRYVRDLGRTLVCTADGQAYYLAFLDVNTPDRRKAIKTQFSEVINHLESLVNILKLVQSARNDDSPLSVGVILRQGELLTLIESAPALKEDLALLVRGEFFRSTHVKTRDQLSHVLDRLTKHGYLMKNTESGSEYTVLGRWSYLYEVMEFIASHESIEDPSQEPVQGALL